MAGDSCQVFVLEELLVLVSYCLIMIILSLR